MQDKEAANMEQLVWMGMGKQGPRSTSCSNFTILQMKRLETPVDDGFASSPQLCCCRLDLAENLLSLGPDLM